MSERVAKASGSSEGLSLKGLRLNKFRCLIRDEINSFGGNVFKLVYGHVSIVFIGSIYIFYVDDS